MYICEDAQIFKKVRKSGIFFLEGISLHVKPAHFFTFVTPGRQGNYSEQINLKFHLSYSKPGMSLDSIE
jgi:hypothetical protein